jgi:hypothetical protein
LKRSLRKDHEPGTIANWLAAVTVLAGVILLVINLSPLTEDPTLNKVLQFADFFFIAIVSGTFYWFIEERRSPKLKLGSLDEIPYRGDYMEPFYVSYDPGELNDEEKEALKGDGGIDPETGRYMEEWVNVGVKGIPGIPGSRDGGRHGYAQWPRRYGMGRPSALQGEITTEEKKKGWLNRGQTKTVDMLFTPTWVGWLKDENKDAVYRHARAKGKEAIPVYVAQSPMPRWGIVPPTMAQQDIKLRDAYREVAEAKEDLKQKDKALRRMVDMLAKLKPKKETEEYE